MSKISKICKIILSFACIFAIIISDPFIAFAETDTAETASKTVRISTKDGEQKTPDDVEDRGPGERSMSSEENPLRKEDGESEKSMATPVERMDITEMKEIHIGSYEDWVSFVHNCTLDSWSLDKYVMLTENIDFSMKEFMPVPYFAGVFDGNGHVINKAAYTNEQNYIGVFSKTAPTAIIRDVSVIGVMKPDGKPFNIGGIVGENAGMIAGCKYDGYVEGYDYIGGIAGYNDATGIISACSVKGKITGLHHVGGICGSSAGLITGCSTDADINTVTKDVQTGIQDIKVEEIFTSLLNKGKEDGNKISIRSSNNPVDIGGIVGHNIGELSSCTSESRVGYEHVGYNVGGIVGRQSGYVHDCKNLGPVTGRKDIGGIVGQAEPYIRLDLNADIISQINTAINELHDSVDVTIKDTDASSGVVSARLNVIQGFADKALTDTGYLANSTVDYVNGVVGSTNEIIGGMEYVVGETSKKDGPMEDISDAGAHLRDTADEVEKLCKDLDFDNYVEGKEKEDFVNAKKNLKERTEYYNSKYEPKYDEQYRLKYYEELTGSAWTPPPDVPTDADLKQEEEGKTESQINTARTNAGTYASTQAKNYADGEYKNKYHAGETPTVPPTDYYADDVAGYTMTIANTVLRRAPEVADNASADGKEATKDLKKMAGDLKDAGQGFKNILHDVASKSAVRFPQLSDEYKLHANSLVANIQGMSDNLGFLNNEMKGSTDTVCHDLEGVNDKFQTVMLLFTDAMDGVLDMDYSTVFQDESEDVCEDSVDATVTACENKGDIYGDINTGGIAGTMAQEYDFDLEGDVTGVKNAAKKSTYRTKCVLRNDTNRGSVKGKKSYVGGACGLHEIGTILRCSNYAKVRSESADYVGGIAGRSYSGIRNCYEKGVLAGQSYIGGIAGASEDIESCVAMPTVTEGTNFVGAIAGSADETGKLKDNVFVSDSLAGVDRISMSGAAEPVSYSQLLSTENIPGDFSIIKVYFIVDDKVIKTLDLKAGDKVTQADAPTYDDAVAQGVEFAEDEYIGFDCEEDIVVNEDLEVNGEVYRLKSSLAGEQVRENKQSIFLVDGRFIQEDNLVVAPVQAPEAGCEEYVLSIPDDGQLGHRIRYQMPEGVESVTVYEKIDGEYKEVECEKFGQYITFDSEGEMVSVKIRPEESKDYKQLIIIAGIAVALIIAIVILIKVLHRRKMRKKSSAGE